MEHGRLTDQAYIDFVKCSEILSDVIRQGDNGFNYEMYEDDLSDYYRLLKVRESFCIVINSVILSNGNVKKLQTNYFQQDLDVPIPTSHSDSRRVDLKFLEPTQPEEESGIFVSPHHQYLDIFNNVNLEDEKAVFRRFAPSTILLRIIPIFGRMFLCTESIHDN